MSGGIVIIAVFVVIFGLIGITEFSKRYLGYRERKLELMADKTAEKAAQYAAHVERLEQRMRVLERIATDKGVQLADQIDDLRAGSGPEAPTNEELN